MKTTFREVKEVCLVLDEDEVIWLKGAMQNPISGGDPDSEDSMDAEMRGRFFDGLSGNT